MEYGLIGEHLGHSFSPEIHAELGNKNYVLHEVPRDALESFMQEADFKGINVTIPYKEAVMPYLDEIAPEALEIGAVNAVVKGEDGRLRGYNTDFYGLRAMSLRAGLDFKGRKVLVAGAGGAAKTAVAVARSLGAAEVVCATRTPRNEEQLRLEEVSKGGPWQIIMNATPVGMYPNDGDRLFDLDKFPALEGVLDCIYNPLRTNLILDAQATGLKAEGGLYMLVAQAWKADEFFFSKQGDPRQLERIYRKLYAQKCNIVLCGMPSSGKTTVGGLLAEMTGRTLYDTDVIIRERSGREIREIFATEGEAAFRQMESQVIEELSHQHSCIIATGGGAVLNWNNVHNLRRTGRIYLLDKNPDQLIPTEDRPLSKDRQALEKLYHTRREAYLRAGECIIDGALDFPDAARAILEDLC